MTDDLTRVVYFSRSAMPENLDELEREIDRILTLSQRNNAEAGVTGALVFSNGAFGQLLEGPTDAVEEIFERIQSDERHHDVTVLDLKLVARREFPEWSMGYVGSRPSHAAAFSVREDLSLESKNGDGVVQLLRRLACEHERL